MVKSAIPTAIEDGPIDEHALSCTFCGPGTWSTWEVITEDGVVFACDRHHAKMSQAKLIQLERMRGMETWQEIREFKETFYQEENQDSLDGSEDLNDYE